MTRDVHSSRGRTPSAARTLAALRRRRDRADEWYAVYRLAVELPRGTVGSAISRAHPELRFEVENRMEVPPDRLLLDARMYGPGAGNLADEFRRQPGVVSVDVQDDGTEIAMYRITLRTPLIQKVAREHPVLTRYPLTIRDGWLRFETVAKASQVRALLRDMTNRVGTSHVEAVRRGPVLARSLGLTPPQDALFRAAMNAGYFGSPRGISVSDLAEKLGRSKSSTSVMLSKIQRRLAESAIQLDVAPLFAGR